MLDLPKRRVLQWIFFIGGLFPLLFPMKAADRKRGGDYWDPKRRSLAGDLFAVLALALTLSANQGLKVYARLMGLPAAPDGWVQFVPIFLFLFLTIAIHESGHAAMALALGCRIRAISIGPVTLEKDLVGTQMRFEWKHVLRSVGYTSWIAPSLENLRWRKMATVAAGPTASLIGGALMLAAFLAAPGAAWERYWWVAAWNACLGFYCALVCLLPVN
jgi:hypothetical protein